MASITLPPLTSSRLALFWETQFTTKPQPPPPSTSLAGQTALITGSNTGIGLEAARIFLELHLSHLIIAVRSVDKGEAVAAPLRQAFPDAKVDVWPLDLLSYPSIQAFASRCASLPRLDIAILNAAVSQPVFTLSPAGHEETFQVNYLSTALLAILLLPILKPKSPSQEPGRLALVSSGLGLQAAFANRDAEPLIPSFDDPTDWGKPAARDRYSITKTLVLMLVYTLSERVSASDVIISAVDPGFTGGSQLHRNLPAPVKAFLVLLKAATARSLQHAAWAYVDAVAVRGEETHGSFVMNWAIYPFHHLMYTPEGKKTMGRLWEETLEELEFVQARKVVDSMKMNV
ncbi:hypothetical protein G7046_g4129 [Stylonectria norvegica]|nr:hypothetical protein G7046_g4129 [Stylonectria norvegica]